ncbi:MAG TPA: 4,5-DOPA dioxygenase extradiol [Burkholderiales bacterium]|nr:4,5-DOPA dioxygenase extradiol [Burkholderiales bacterium]
MPHRLPALFFGHGNPMNALLRNAYTEGWAAMGTAMPRPRAVLAISAHWYRDGLSVTMHPHPRTIHDFGGFPRELFEFEYAAPGDPALAARVQRLLEPAPVSGDETWGLDHGVWAVLCHAFPNADVPVVQLSLAADQPPSFHYQLGRRLAPLRDDGVLIVGSGNIVHNLHAYAWGQHAVAPYDWATRFESRIRDFLIAGKDAAIVDYELLGRDAVLAAPTPEHFLPLLYIVGLRAADEPVSFPVQGVDGGSISMLSVKVG